MLLVSSYLFWPRTYECSYDWGIDLNPLSFKVFKFVGVILNVLVLGSPKCLSSGNVSIIPLSHNWPTLVSLFYFL